MDTPIVITKTVRLAVVLFAAVFTSGASAAELAVAAAANVKFAFDDLIANFHESHPGVRVRVTYGSSGSFVAQIRNQAPFDLFFSADVDFPRQLADEGLALDGGLFPYAVGRIVVWVPAGSPVNMDRDGIRALLDPAVRRVAIPNPRHAPYGVAAVAALKSLEVFERVEPKLVYGENVAQAAQFAQSGAADAGIVALSIALSPGMRDTGRYWDIPADRHPPVVQAGIILRRTREPDQARTFRDFVLGEAGRAVLLRFGYARPE